MPKVAPEYKQLASQRITEAALRAFSRKGYRETGMEDVAREVGVSKAALYRYFEGKEELFRAVVDLVSNVAIDGIRAGFADKTFDPNSFFGAIGDRMWSAKLFLDAMAASFTDEKLRAEMTRGYINGVQIIESFVKEQQAAGAFTKDLDSHRLAMGLFALHDGLLITEVARISREERSEALIAAVDAMLKGILEKKE